MADCSEDASGSGEDSPCPRLLAVVADARRGDGEAWRELVRRLSPAMRAEARRHRLGHADVDEVVQFAWAQCFEALDQLRSDASLPAWLLATCRHRAVGIIREQRRCRPTDRALEPPGDDAGLAGPLDDVLAGEQRAALAGAVDGLPPRQRVLLSALLEVDDTHHAYRELAADLAIPIGSIGPTRQRAVASLRRTLGQPALARPASGAPART